MAEIADTLQRHTIAVIGTGYVGLTLSLTFAELGFCVYGIEANTSIVAQLNAGRPHIFEHGIQEALDRSLGKTFFVSNTIPKLPINTFIIAVGTPLQQDDPEEVDFTAIKDAAQQIGKAIGRGALVVLRSTVPVKTSRDIVLPIIERVSGLRAGEDFYVVFAPERTLAGRALQETRELPQIIGGIDQASLEQGIALFSQLTSTVVPMSSLESAEMVKLLDNTYRDLRFAYANEVAIVCENLHLNALEIITAANREYIRNSIPVPSPGVGGYCLSKDPYIFLSVAKKHGHKIKILKRARTVNEFMPLRIVQRLKSKLAEQGKSLATAKIFVAGFAFKGHPATDDMRHSTTLAVVDELKKYTQIIHAFDPVISADRLRASGVRPVSFSEGVKGADVVLVLNNHLSFKDIDVAELAHSVASPAIYFDAWQMLDPEKLKPHQHITYMSVGY